MLQLILLLCILYTWYLVHVRPYWKTDSSSPEVSPFISLFKMKAGS